MGDLNNRHRGSKEMSLRSYYLLLVVAILLLLAAVVAFILMNLSITGILLFARMMRYVSPAGRLLMSLFALGMVFFIYQFLLELGRKSQD